MGARLLLYEELRKSQKLVSQRQCGSLALGKSATALPRNVPSEAECLNCLSALQRLNGS